jgi:hypothetical protein
MFWNFGYHVAHHINPRLHWTELKQAQERLPIRQGALVVPSVMGLIVPDEFVWSAGGAERHLKITKDWNILACLFPHLPSHYRRVRETSPIDDTVETDEG